MGRVVGRLVGGVVTAGFEDPPGAGDAFSVGLVGEGDAMSRGSCDGLGATTAGLVGVERFGPGESNKPTAAPAIPTTEPNARSTSRTRARAWARTPAGRPGDATTRQASPTAATIAAIRPAARPRPKARTGWGAGPG